MNLDDFSFINESFEASAVSGHQLDALLAGGWRHFGRLFFRYNLAPAFSEIRFVVPLRIRLSNFSTSKSQRRVLRKNQDLRIVNRPAIIDRQKIELFEKHKMRFGEHIPESIYNFVDKHPATTPCETREICLFDDQENLLAASFFDIGSTAVSAIYAMFDPDEAKRSLGIYTMMLEIQYSIEKGKSFYYEGYAYEGKSFYDYKKKFRSLERFDWKGNWHDFSEN